MIFIKVKNGSICLQHSIFNDDRNFILVLNSMILKGLNFINFESYYSIKIKQN